MTSPLVALFTHSLRRDFRQTLRYFTRVGLVVVALLFLLTVRVTAGWGETPGMRFFAALVLVDFLLILLAGCSHFAAAITEEKEEMTLGLLRMTNLDALSILLGKSTSRVVNALLFLLAQLPFALLALSLGGVTLRQIAAAFFTLSAAIVFIANLALLASVICRRTTGAAVLTAFTLFFFFVAVPLLDWALALPRYLGASEPPSFAAVAFDHLAAFVARASPAHRLTDIFTTGFSDQPFGPQVWIDLGLGVILFLLAWSVFEFFCSEQPEATPPRHLVTRRTSLLHWLGAGRAWRRALAWKDFYFLTGGKSWLVLRFVIYAALPAAFLAVQWHWWHTTWTHELGRFVFWNAFIFGIVELAILAASVFRQERQWRTLSSVVALPMSIRQFAYQKLLGCLPALIPALCFLVCGLVCAGRFSPQPWSARDFYWAAQFLLFLHVVAALSLHLRRGALPVAIAIHAIFNLLVGIAVLVSREKMILSVLSIVFLGGTIFAHWHLGRRLETLAAEE